MRVDRIDLLARRVTHKGLSDFLHNAGFEQARVKGVAQVVEADGAQTGTAERRLPGGLDPRDRFFVEGEEQPFRLTSEAEVVEDAVGERNRTALAAGCFRVGDQNQPSREIDMLPALA